VAPWWWFPCKPKHVGTFLLILKCFNNSTFYNVVCISWKLKCWILLMHGATMKFMEHECSQRWTILLFLCFPYKLQRNTAVVTTGNLRFVTPDLFLVTWIWNCITDAAEGVPLNKQSRLKVSLILEGYLNSATNVLRSLLCINHAISKVSCHLGFSYNSKFCCLESGRDISEPMRENKTS